MTPIEPVKESSILSFKEPESSTDKILDHPVHFDKQRKPFQNTPLCETQTKLLKIFTDFQNGCATQSHSKKMLYASNCRKAKKNKSPSMRAPEQETSSQQQESVDTFISSLSDGIQKIALNEQPLKTQRKEKKALSPIEIRSQALKKIALTNYIAEHKTIEAHKSALITRELLKASKKEAPENISATVTAADRRARETHTLILNTLSLTQITEAELKKTQRLLLPDEIKRINATIKRLITDVTESKKLARISSTISRKAQE